MKRFFKHLFQTILLIALAWLIVQIPNNPNMFYWNIAVWGIIFCLMIGMGIYLYRGHKKGLFALLLFTVLFPSLSAIADSRVVCENEISVTAPESVSGCPTDSGAEAYYKCLLEETRKVRGETWEFHQDAPFLYTKDGHYMLGCDPNKELDEEVIQAAVRYVDAYDRALAAGVAEKSGMLMHQFRLFMSDAENQYDFAKQYLDKVAECKKKQYEERTKTVQMLLEAESGKCWPCGIIHTLLYATEWVTLSLEDVLSDAALKLLGIMFLFWILVKVLMLIGQFGTANNAEFFTDFLIRSILAIIAAVLLTTSMGEVYRLTFSPFIDTTLHITEKFLDPYKNTNQGLGTQLAGETHLGCNCCPDDSNYSEDNDCNSDNKGNNGKISVCKLKYDDGSESVGLFEKQTKQHILCTVCKIYKQTAPLVASGRVLVYQSWAKQGLLQDVLDKAADWLGGIVKGIAALSKVPSPFCMWVLGVSLVISFSWLAFVVAFRLIDIFLRIGFAILLTPFLITTFVFPISRQYTKRGWDFLVHAALSIMAIGMGISLVMAAFMVTLPESASGELKNIIQQTDTDDVNDYAVSLMNAFGVYSGDESVKGVSSWYMAFYLLMVCFFGINVIKASQVVIEGLSGLSCGIPPIAGAAVMGAIRAALAPFRMIKNVALDWLESVPGVGVAASAAKVVDPTKKDGSENDNASPENVGIFATTGKFAGEGAGRTAEAIQKGVGSAESGLGGGMAKLGAKIAPVGYGLGSIIGVPLMIAGAALKAKGEATKATAGMTRQAVKKSVETAGKNVQRGWNRVKRNIKNRMKKMVNAAIKKPYQAIKNLPKNIKNLPKAIKRKFLKATRRMRAKRKYRQQKRSGRGPANWKPTRREGQRRTDQNRSNGEDTRNQNEQNNNRRGNNQTAQPKESRGRRIARGVANIADTVESPIDNTLDTAEQSVSDDPGNHS